MRKAEDGAWWVDVSIYIISRICDASLMRLEGRRTTVAGGRHVHRNSEGMGEYGALRGRDMAGLEALVWHGGDRAGGCSGWCSSCASTRERGDLVD